MKPRVKQGILQPPHRFDGQTEEAMNYHRRNASRQLPVGARKFKTRIRDARIEGLSRNPSQRVTAFSIDGECKGKLEDVMALGLQMVHEAIADGGKPRRNWARKALRRLNQLPLEYEAARLRALQKAQRTRLENQIRTLKRQSR